MAASPDSRDVTSPELAIDRDKLNALCRAVGIKHKIVVEAIGMASGPFGKKLSDLTEFTPEAIQTIAR